MKIIDNAPTTSTTTTTQKTGAERAAEAIARHQAAKAAAPQKAAPTTVTAMKGNKPVTVKVLPPPKAKLDPEQARQQQLLERLNACPAISEKAQETLDAYLALSSEERVAWDARAKASLAFLPKAERYVGVPEWLVPGARIRFTQSCEKPNLRGKTGMARRIGRQKVVCDVDNMRTEGYVLIGSLEPEFIEEEEVTTDEGTDETTAEATVAETEADLTAAVAEQEETEEKGEEAPLADAGEETPAATGTDNEL